MDVEEAPGSEGFADAVVVAAGRSRRMGGQDKLMAPLAGRPLLSWCLGSLAAAPAVGALVVVAAPERVADLAAAPWLQASGARVVAGGAWRVESSRAGLAATRPEAEVVLIHDGARPFVSPALVEAVARAARTHGAAIPVTPVSESVKRVTAGRVAAAVEREGLVLAQTPQAARRSLLVEAFTGLTEADPSSFTDEAAVLASAGFEVVTVPGEVDNLKVTTPDDLARATALAGSRSPAEGRAPAEGRDLADLAPSPSPRLAEATDSHPFGPQDGLALGGILIADAPRLHGHSDGDVALHAVADAILGGARRGDLGRLFPAGDPATRGIGSDRLLRRAVEEAARAGWRPAAVDLHIEAARPILGPARLEAMRRRIAELAGVPEEEVSVRASSGNLDGPTGAGRSIAARALVTLLPGTEGET
ncbi:MAG TPA: 2-C-methyl-D-erythritol 4-phosphate cytidylyltransferase [Candidatus Limnocylindrales bacterium]|nr:2-C-methyl-D-erythritol 4-phosphate cytidylyltransferase [Candidatus Limnocylindrales bacterium]